MGITIHLPRFLDVALPPHMATPKKKTTTQKKAATSKSPQRKKTRQKKARKPATSSKSTTKAQATKSTSNTKAPSKRKKPTQKKTTTTPSSAAASTKPKTSKPTSPLRRFKQRLIIAVTLALLLVISGFFIPERIVIPVEDASAKDWHRNSFWYYPWGKSGVHRGIDIFAPVGRPVLSASSGLVVEAGTRSMGGNVITILGPKWRLHYYAHLSKKQVRLGYWVNAGDIIGAVGSSGNAVGKTPHLHYSIRTIVPYFWRSDKTPYGSLKKWYINPTPYFYDYLRQTNKKLTRKNDKQHDKN